VWPFAQSYATALSTAFLPAAASAVGARRPGGVLRLFAWACLLALLWCVLGDALLLALARYIARVFGDAPGLIDATVRMLTATYACKVLNGQVQLTVPLQQAIGRPWTAVALSIATEFAPVPAFGALLFATDPDHNLFRLMWMYSIASILSGVVCCGFAVGPLRRLWRDAREEAAVEIEAFHRPDEPLEGGAMAAEAGEGPQGWPAGDGRKAADVGLEADRPAGPAGEVAEVGPQAALRPGEPGGEGAELRSGANCSLIGRAEKHRSIERLRLRNC
jgi:hypothetical protein